MKKMVKGLTRLWPALLLSIVLVGCATTPKIDWNSRVGNLSYDQAIMEMGPPDKSAKLQDGTVVAEWLSGRTPSTVVGLGVGSGYYWGGGVDYSVLPGYDRVLRLVFRPDGKLQTWQKFVR